MRAQLACLLVLFLCLTACGDRTIDLCAPLGSVPAPAYDNECKGKVACTSLGFRNCDCGCMLCDKERCVQGFCDDDIYGYCGRGPDRGIDLPTDAGLRTDVETRDQGVDRSTDADSRTDVETRDMEPDNDSA